MCVMLVRRYKTCWYVYILLFTFARIRPFLLTYKCFVHFSQMLQITNATVNSNFNNFVFAAKSLYEIFPYIRGVLDKFRIFAYEIKCETAKCKYNGKKKNSDG